MKDKDEAVGGEGPVDLRAWESDSPPDGFAERVLARVRDMDVATSPVRVEIPATTARARPGWLFGGAAAALAVAAAVLLGGSRPSEGEAIAKDRSEVSIGGRAVAVLEPGAEVHWKGDDVVQPRGDVFYRVERGKRFTVHTPTGDVEVKGTCFAVKVRPAAKGNEEVEMQKRDLKVAAASAVASALTLVAVYEGHVAVSHASESVELRAGQSARSSASGVKRTGSVEDAEKALDKADELTEGDPSSKANQNLVRQIGEYRSRLEAVTAQKADLETKLSRSEANYAASHDGAAAVPKHDFDVTADEWQELAKDGTIKFQMPCVGRKDDPWSPSAEKLNALGLAPGDAAPIRNAYARSSDRVWAAIKPLCAQALGSADLAEKIGAQNCIHITLSVESEKDPEAAKAARRLVGEVRAGSRPVPDSNAPLHPVAKLFLATTGASKNLENDLAETFGPDEAHRLVYSDELCMGSSIFGSSGKKK